MTRVPRTSGSTSSWPSIWASCFRLLFWAASDYMVSRQFAVGLFLVCQLCYIVYSLAVMGFLPMLLPRASVGAMDQFTSLMVCLAPLLSLAFHRVLLGLFAPPRLALRVLDVLIFLDLIALVMLSLGYARQALQLNAFLILLAAPTFIALAFLARLNAAPGLRAIRIIYSLQGMSLRGFHAAVSGLGYRDRVELAGHLAAWVYLCFLDVFTAAPALAQVDAARPGKRPLIWR